MKKLFFIFVAFLYLPLLLTLAMIAVFTKVFFKYDFTCSKFVVAIIKPLEKAEDNYRFENKYKK